jgi:hypothetical protein
MLLVHLTHLTTVHVKLYARLREELQQYTCRLSLRPWSSYLCAYSCHCYIFAATTEKLYCYNRAALKYSEKIVVPLTAEELAMQAGAEADAKAEVLLLL